MVLSGADAAADARSKQQRLDVRSDDELATLRTKFERKSERYQAKADDLTAYLAQIPQDRSDQQALKTQVDGHVSDIGEEQRLRREGLVTR